MTKETPDVKSGREAGWLDRSFFGVRHSHLMGLSALAVLAAALAGFAARRVAPRTATGEAKPAVEVQTARPPTETLTDPAEVFQKAFWKRPTAADKILHAERREWADADGLQKWQWFIAVEPSSALVKHLRVDNAFNLVPAASVPPASEAPPWFAFDSGDVEILHSPRGNLQLFFSKTERALYATDAGHGFRPGAPEPAPQPLSQTTSTGRLPPTSPPNPTPP